MSESMVDNYYIIKNAGESDNRFFILSRLLIGLVHADRENYNRHSLMIKFSLKREDRIVMQPAR